MYNKLFNASNLGNYQIKQKLNITYTSVLQYRKTNKVDIELFVKFGKLLGFTDTQLSEMIRDEIIELYKKK